MRKLLLIENDEDTIEILKIAFAETYEVYAFNSRVTLEQVEDIKPNIAIIDYLLDDCLGTEICVMIRENPSTNHVPLILFSASQDIEKMQHRNCADAFVAKPFNYFELQDIVDQLALSGIKKVGRPKTMA